VPVCEGDTPAALHARIQEQEHSAYPEALQRLAEGRLQVVGRIVKTLR
jgi:phosphoribosylglycinamide formyltransferase 1